MLPPIDQDSTPRQTDHLSTRRSLLKNAVQQGLILYAAPRILYSGSVQAQGFISGIPNGFGGGSSDIIPVLAPPAAVAAGTAGGIPPVASVVPVAAAGGGAGGAPVAAPVIPGYWTSPAASSGPGVDPLTVLGAPLVPPMILAQAGPAASGGSALLPPDPVRCSKRRSKKDKLPPGCKVKKAVRGLG